MRWRFSWQVLALSLLGCAGAWGAVSGAQVQGLAGIWKLSTDGVDGNCRILLRLDVSASGRNQETVPLACLRAFRALGRVKSWNFTPEGHLEFSGGRGQSVLDFVANAHGFVAAGPQGELDWLAALTDAAPRNKAFREQGGSRPPPAPIAMTREPPAAAQGDPGGRYSILREDGKDTGCMLTLDNKGKTPSKAKASLAPGCRDHGIVIFDPAAWQVVNGRLELIARKGHKTHLDPQPDGTWKKDPREGKTLSLKKL